MQILDCYFVVFCYVCFVFVFNSTHSYRDGGACFKQCSSEDFLLSNFTFAGLGVQSRWLRMHLPTSSPPYCLWLVSPSSNYNTTFSHLSQITTFRNSPNSSLSRSFNQSVHDSAIFNFTVQFSANLTASANFNSSSSSSSSSPLQVSSECYQETVLIYDGLPCFLNVLNGKGRGGNQCGIPEQLVASLTGSQLRDASLSLSSPFLTFVYYYDGNVSNVKGFSATVKAVVEHDMEKGKEEEEEGEVSFVVIRITLASDRKYLGLIRM